MNIADGRGHLLVGQEPPAAEGVLTRAVGAGPFGYSQTGEGRVADEDEIARRPRDSFAPRPG